MQRKGEKERDTERRSEREKDKDGREYESELCLYYYMIVFLTGNDIIGSLSAKGFGSGGGK